MGKSENISQPVIEANLSDCHPSHQVLFEPVQIGPVTAPNRFYQVPHASGMTETHPRVRAAFRETKAEGGYSVLEQIDDEVAEGPFRDSLVTMANERIEELKG